MLVRLWWKEWRTMWPLWVAMPVLAGVFQVLMLAVAEADVRRGILVPLALGWAAIYALAVSSAAFAGERENQTLLWLDMLPVSRRVLWGSKVSFALLTTALLVVPLAILGVVGSPDRTVFAYRVGYLVVGFGALFIECAAWGAFWSALLRNALFAGTLATVCASTAFVVLDADVISDPGGFQRSAPVIRDEAGNPLALFFDLGAFQRRAPLRVGLAAILGVVSLQVMTVRPSRAPRASRVATLTPTVAQRLGRQPRPRYSANRSLAWLARRQALWIWIAFTGIVAMGLLGFYVWTEGRTSAAGLLPVLCGFTGTVAGICIFHPDNRGRMYRFYVHHGVSPARIWCVKVAVWTVPVAVLSLLAALLGWFATRHEVWAPEPISMLVGVLISPVVYGFVAGLIAGQFVERAISAAVAAFGIWILLWPIHAASAITEFFPVWFLAIPPAIVLLASFASVRDWTLRGPGAGRGLRLTAWLLLPFAAYLTGVIAYRAWSLPKIPPIAPPAIVSEGINGAEAADFYASALRAESGADNAFTAVQNGGFVRADSRPDRTVQPIVLDDVVVGKHDPKDPDVMAWWRANRKAIDLVRQGSQQRISGFYVPNTLIPEARDVKIGRQNLEVFAWLMALDARECAANGELRQAWDDVRTVWRMARQASVGTDVSWTILAAQLDRKASHMAMLWAQDRHQTRELLHTALDDLRGMPERVPLADAYRTEAQIWERTISLPFHKLKPLYYESFGRNSFGRLEFLNPWERERGRRGGRLLFEYAIEEAGREPWKGSVKTLRVQTADGNLEFSADEALAAFRSTPVLMRLCSGVPWGRKDFVDRALVDRRALVQVLALRSWAIAHNGNLPQRIDELVPSELSRLPIDPYSGHPFRYEPDEARMASPLGWFASGGANPWKYGEEGVRGARVLSSVGPKETPYLPAIQRGQILYAIPGNMPEPNAKAAPEQDPAQP